MVKRRPEYQNNISIFKSPLSKIKIHRLGRLLIVLILNIILTVSSFADDRYIKADEECNELLTMIENNGKDIIAFIEDNNFFTECYNSDEITPLIQAIKSKLFYLVHYLIKVDDVDVNYQGFFRNTALHYAARQGSSDIVKFLLINGADPNLQTVRDETPLDKIRWRLELKIVKKKYKKIYDLLIKYGAY